MLSPRSTPTPELARALAQLINEGTAWTTVCRQLRVNVSRATHWRSEQPWFGTLCRLAVMAAYIECIERLNPGAVSKERPHLLDAAESVRAALHAPLPTALDQLLQDPPLRVDEDDDVLVREGVWRMERAERRRRERVAQGEIPPEDHERGERGYQALKVVFAAAEGENVEEEQLAEALRTLREVVA